MRTIEEVLESREEVYSSKKEQPEYLTISGGGPPGHMIINTDGNIFVAISDRRYKKVTLHGF